MPRSYRFDHFTASKPDTSKVGTPEDSKLPVKSEAAGQEPEGLHYGRHHTQTVERVQARRMDLEMDETPESSMSAHRDDPPEAAAPARKAKASPRKRAAATRKSATRAGTAQRATGTPKRERHTTVARRGTSTRKATGARKAAATRTPPKSTRGKKEVRGTGAMARTGRGRKQAPAKKTTRGTARRTPKKR